MVTGKSHMPLAASVCAEAAGKGHFCANAKSRKRRNIKKAADQVVSVCAPWQVMQASAWRLATSHEALATSH